MQLFPRFSQNTTESSAKHDISSEKFTVFFLWRVLPHSQTISRWPHLSPQAIILYPPHATPEFSQIDVYMTMTRYCRTHQALREGRLWRAVRSTGQVHPRRLRDAPSHRSRRRLRRSSSSPRRPSRQGRLVRRTRASRGRHLDLLGPSFGRVRSTVGRPRPLGVWQDGADGRCRTTGRQRVACASRRRAIPRHQCDVIRCPCDAAQRLSTDLSRLQLQRHRRMYHGSRCKRIVRAPPIATPVATHLGSLGTAIRSRPCTVWKIIVCAGSRSRSSRAH